MLDPFTAVSLASAIVQFVDFSWKLVKGSKEIAEHGSTRDYVALDVVTADLNSISKKLTPPVSNAFPAPLSRDENAIWQLAGQCTDVSQELSSLLEKLRLKDRNGKWKTFRIALKSILNQSEIAALEKNIDRLRSQLNTHLLVDLSHQESHILARLDGVARENIKLGTSTSFEIDKLRREIRSTAKIWSTEATKIDRLAEISTKLLQLAEDGRNITISQKILDSLRFTDMYARKSQIHKAHENTFEWMLEEVPDHKRNKKDTGFVRWLKSSEGIYWITGKAGSGKSTLMKMLSQHPQSKRLLSNWAGDKRLVFASHFFWTGGTPAQKSQVGLLRSLLYQLLIHHAALAPKVCSNHWNIDTLDSSAEWTLEELSQAIENLAKETSLTTKYCFFIDGLDEYSGEHSNLVRMIRRLAACPGVKVCVSSRPWIVFENAFGQEHTTKMALHEYTKEDISIYTKAVLGESTLFLQMARKDPEYQELIDEIVRKAQGVFLWVFLAVKSLLRGLEDDNELSMLRKRLNNFPSELRDFFQRMIDTLDDFYRETTARILLVITEAERPLSVLALSFIEQDMEDTNYVFEAEVGPLSGEDQKTYRKLATHLIACCKDLIEITLYEEEESFLRRKVDFLHRTVKDFLSEQDIVRTLKARAAVDFNPRTYLVKAYLYQVKRLTRGSGEEVQPRLKALLHLAEECVESALKIELLEQQASVKLLDELDRAMSIQTHSWNTHGTSIGAGTHWTNLATMEYGSKSFLAFAIEERLELYVLQKLDQQPNLTRGNDRRLLLSCALHPKIKFHEMPRCNMRILAALLDAGASPNSKLSAEHGPTVWTKFLVVSNTTQKDGTRVQDFDRTSREVNYQIIDLLLRHGADPNIRITDRDLHYQLGTRGGSSYITVAEAIRPLVSEEDYAELEPRLRRSRGLQEWIPFLPKTTGMLAGWPM